MQMKKVVLDPFVVALKRILAERDMSIKELSLISKVNDQTIRKLIRESRASNKLRDAIAKSLGFESFADLYKIGKKPDQLIQDGSTAGLEDKNEMGEVLRRLESLENKFDCDLRNIRTQIDTLTRLMIDRPFVKRATDHRKAN